MKKSKILTSAFAAIMALSMSVPAYAGTITVENADPGTDETVATESYQAFKIFDASKNASGEGVTYKIKSTDPWFSVLFNNDGTPVAENEWFTLQEIPGQSNANFTMYQVIPTSAMNADADAKDCADWLYENRGSIEGEALTIGINNVDDGYYLVQSSLGKNLGIATSDFGMTIVEKNTFPTIDKRQNDVSASSTYTDNGVEVAINDYIYYDIDVFVPETADKDLTITDTMSTGLEWDSTAGVTAMAGDAKDNYTAELGSEDFTVDTTNGAVTFTVAIHPTDATLGKHVSLRFRAQVKPEALLDSSKENAATLTYSNYSQSDDVDYTTSASGAQKYDGATATLDATTNVLSGNSITYLDGAVFKLQVSEDGSNYQDLPVVYDAAGYYRPATASESGIDIITDSSVNSKFVIRGLDEDKHYQLVETAAPNGYNLMTEPAALVLAANNDGTDLSVLAEAPETAITKIANNTGSTLPTTGGIGTTIFYIIGATLIVGAGITLATKARMRKDVQE